MILRKPAVQCYYWRTKHFTVLKDIYLGCHENNQLYLSHKNCECIRDLNLPAYNRPLLTFSYSIGTLSTDDEWDDDE